MFTALNKLCQAFLVRLSAVDEQAGQALIEYSLVLGLLSLVALVALTAVGQDVSAALEKLAEMLAGI
jgi:Flp pilus assembly pilin Flp